MLPSARRQTGNSHASPPAFSHIEPVTGAAISLGDRQQRQQPTNHLVYDTADRPVVVTSRRRGPQNQVSRAGYSSSTEGGTLRAPWAESAPLAPAESTTHTMLQDGEDRDRNFRKHLRRQFKQYHLEHLIPSTLKCGEEESKEVDDEDDARNATKFSQSQQHNDDGGANFEYGAKRYTGSGAAKQFPNYRGVRDLKLTTLPNKAKRTYTGNRGAPGASLNGDASKFCRTIDEIGQDQERNVQSSTSLHGSTNHSRRTRLQPFLVYEDEVSQLPAVPTVGITFTGHGVEQHREEVFPWDRPRCDREGAGKLARREARRLVTQRRLEFAEQFLPEVCTGMTTKISDRVASQFLESRPAGQPVPLALGALADSSMRPAHIAQQTAFSNPTAAAKKKKTKTGGAGGGGAAARGGGGDRGETHRNSTDELLSESDYQQHNSDSTTARAGGCAFSSGRHVTIEHGRRASSGRHHHHHRNTAVERARQAVQSIVQDHEKSLQKHEVLMSVAVASL